MKDANYKIIRFDEAAQMVGKGRSTLWNEIKNGLFIPPVSLGPRTAGFIESEVQAMIAARALGFSSEQITALISRLIQQRNDYASRLLEAVAV